MRNNFSDKARKSFPRHNRQKSFFNKQIKFLAALLVAKSSDFVHVITYLWRFQIAHKPSRLSKNFPGYPEIFQIGWGPSRLSKKNPDCPETFQTWSNALFVKRVNQVKKVQKVGESRPLLLIPKKSPSEFYCTFWVCYDPTFSQFLLKGFKQNSMD